MPEITLNSGFCPVCKKEMPMHQHPKEDFEVYLECSKGWARRCQEAKSQKCNCRCKGRWHGKTRQTSIFDIITPET